MKVTFLGTGTSQGVPVIGHECEGLDLGNVRNWRTRSSVHVEVGGVHIQVDVGPEFRLQCLWNKVEQVDYVIVTHEHTDHVAGMDDLRVFCYDGALPVYSTEAGLRRVRGMFPYAVGKKAEEVGYPVFDLREMPGELDLGVCKVYSTLLPHGKCETLGLVFEEKGSGRKVVYFNDCKEVTERGYEIAGGAEVVIVDGLRYHPHATHMSVEEAVGVIRRIGPRAGYLTHTTYYLDYEKVSGELPEGVYMAYDGLVVEV